MQATRSKRRQGSRSKLSRAAIIDCALALVRSDGLEALTMRRVAAELNAGAMSLYRHVADRDDLLVGMMDRMAGSIQAPDVQADDREEIIQIMMAFHLAFRSDPWLVRVLLFEGRGSLNTLPMLERLCTAMNRLGCDTGETIELYSMLLHYAYGESLSFQTKKQRAAVREAWDDTEFEGYPAIATMMQAAETWAYDEFERNVRRIVNAI